MSKNKIPITDNKSAAILETGSSEEKILFLDSLSQCHDTSHIDALILHLEKETSRAFKERILLVLGHLLPLTDFKNIDPMLRSPDPFIRNGAVEIIKNSNIPIIRFLERLAEDGDKDVRKFVIDSLSNEPSEQALDILRRRLDDADTNILYTAVEYLGNLKDKPSAERIENILLNSDQLMVICASLEALAKIGHSPHKEMILEKFMKSSGNPLITFPLLRYLATFGSVDTLPFIEYVLDSGAEIYTKEVVDTLEGLIRNQQISRLPDSLHQKLEILRQETSNGMNKYALTRLLVHIGSDDQEEKRNTLRAMLQDQDVIVRLCAVELLGTLGNMDDIPLLEEIAEKNDSSELIEAIVDTIAAILQRWEENPPVDPSDLNPGNQE